MTNQKSLSDHASESGHFYYPDGRTAYTVIGKNGKERNTTKADARKLGLYPGTTTITDEASSYGLGKYKINQAIEAALTLPRHEGENSADYIKRVRHDAKEHARIRAEEGTAIHAYLQQRFEGKSSTWEAMNECYEAAEVEIAERIGAQKWICEKSFGIYISHTHRIIYLIQRLSKTVMDHINNNNISHNTYNVF